MGASWTALGPVSGAYWGVLGEVWGRLRGSQGVFERLPTEREGFRNVATSCNTFFCLVQEAVVTSSLRYTVAAI